MFIFSTFLVETFSYFTVSGTVRIRLLDKGPYSVKTYIDDLKRLFPEEDFSLF